MIIDRVNVLCFDASFAIAKWQKIKTRGFIAWTH
jgi:hypothetical protein